MKGSIFAWLFILTVFLFSGCTNIKYSSVGPNGVSKDIQYTTLFEDMGSPAAKIGGDSFTAVSSSMSINTAEMIDALTTILLKKYNLPDMELPKVEVPEADLPGDVVPPSTEEPTPAPKEPENNFPLSYHGDTNENRPTFYTYKNQLMDIGDNVKVVMGDKTWNFVAKRRDNGSIGYDEDSGFVVKNSEVNGRGIAVLLPEGSSRNANPAYVSIK